MVFRILTACRSWYLNFKRSVVVRSSGGDFLLIINEGVGLRSWSSGTVWFELLVLILVNLSNDKLKSMRKIG